MPGGAVLVAPPAVGGQQLTQRGEQVGVAARPGLDHGEARSGMRYPHVQQAIVRVRVVEERTAFRSEVVYLLARAGLDADFAAVHPNTVTPERGPLVAVTAVNSCGQLGGVGVAKVLSRLP